MILSVRLPSLNVMLICLHVPPHGRCPSSCSPKAVDFLSQVLDCPDEAAVKDAVSILQEIGMALMHIFTCCLSEASLLKKRFKEEKYRMHRPSCFINWTG